MTTGPGACRDKCTAVATPLKPPPTTRTRGRAGPGDRACDKDRGGARPGSRPGVASSVMRKTSLARWRSVEPALPGRNSLGAEAALGVVGEAEVELADVLPAAQFGGRAAQGGAAVLEDVGVVRVAERRGRILLGDQEGEALAPVQVAQGHEDLLDDQRCEAHRGLVQDDQAGLAHERPADRGHLLLAAGGVAGALLPLLFQAWEVAVDPLEVRRDLAPAGTAGEGARDEVLLDGELREAVAALEHLDHAALHHGVGREAGGGLAVEQDPAAHDLPALRLQQVGDGLEGRALPGPVGAEEGDDLARRHLERDPAQGEDGLVVGDLDAGDAEQRPVRAGHRTPWALGGGERAPRAGPAAPSQDWPAAQSRGVMCCSSAYLAEEASI